MAVVAIETQELEWKTKEREGEGAPSCPLALDHPRSCPFAAVLVVFVACS